MEMKPQFVKRISHVAAGTRSIDERGDLADLLLLLSEEELLLQVLRHVLLLLDGERVPRAAWVCGVLSEHGDAVPAA